MVNLFKRENFTVGAGLAKSEAIMAAVFGYFFFETRLSLQGWFGVLLGGAAVFLLSWTKGSQKVELKTAAIGVASGSSFALTSLLIRESSLASGLPFPFGAIWTLFLVLLIQTVSFTVLILLREPDIFQKLWLERRLVFLASLTSCLGSLGWFGAMSLEIVPYVKTLGQIEVIFTLGVAYLWLKEKPKTTDLLGILLIGIAAILVCTQDFVFLGF